MKKILIIFIVLLNISTFGQTILTPGDILYFNSGSFYYNLPVGTYMLYDDGGPSANYSNNIASEINLYAPYCKINISGSCAANYPGDWFSISNVCGDDVRHSSSGSPWMATINHNMYSFARVRFRSDASTTASGFNLTVTVTPIDGVHNVEVTDITCNSAQISWEDEINTSWTVQYGYFGFTWGTGTIINTNTPSVTLNGLSSATHYSYYVYPTGYTPTNSTPTSPNAYSQYFYRCNLEDLPLDFLTPCCNNLGSCFNFTDLVTENVHGSYGTFANPNLNSGIVDNGPSSITSRQTVHSNINEKDPRTGYNLYTVPPCATSSVRIGNWGVGAQAESITYDYTVNTDESDLMIFRYAALLQNPGHPSEQQPVLTFKFLDENNNEIDQDCFSANFVASQSLGWNTVNYSTYETLSGSGDNGTMILWKDWTSVGIDLTNLNGQTIKIQITTYDCAQGGHFGYAYFHFSCGRRIITALACGDNLEENTFSAPPGFNYNWYWATDPNTTISTNQDVTVSQEGSLFCECSFIGSPDCSFTLQAIAGPRYPLAQFSYVQEGDCGTTVSFTNTSTVSEDGITPNGAGEQCETAHWDFGDGTTSDEYNPTHVFANGTYTVTLTAGLANDACTDQFTQTITVGCDCTNPPTLNLTTTSATTCSGVAFAIEGITFGGSATQVAISHNGFGTLSSATSINSPFFVTYTPSLLDAGNIVTIHFTTDNPLGSPCMPATTDFQLTIHTLPTAPVTVNATETTLCEGETTIVTAIGGNGVSFQWRQGSAIGPVVGTDPNSLNATPSSSITYYGVWLDACGNAATQSVLINVTPQPVIPTATTDCSNGYGNAVVTVTLPIGSQYEYSINGGSYQSSNIFTGVDNGNYTVSVRVQGSDCISTSNLFSINCDCENPPTIALSSSPSQIKCTSENIMVSGNAFGGSTTQITLSHNGGGTLNQNIFTTTPFNFTYTPSLTDAGNMVTITATTNNPNGFPCIEAVAVYTINFRPMPVSPTNINALPATICAGNPTTLTFSGGSGDTFAWYEEGCGGLGSAQQPIGTENNFVVNPTITTTYYGRWENECGNSDCMPITIAINLITNTLTATICEGENYNQNGFNENTAATYNQNLTSVLGCDSIVTLILSVAPKTQITEKNATICYNSDYTESHFNITNITENHIYYDTLPNINGCDSIIKLNLTVLPSYMITMYDTICQGRDGIQKDTIITKHLYTQNGCDSILITNLYVIVPNVKITTYPKDYCEEHNINLTAETEQQNILWNTGSEANSITVLYPGIYTVYVSDGENCTDTVAEFIVRPCIDDLFIPNCFTPNGDGYNDTWVIDNINLYEIFEVHVFNRWGQELYECKKNYEPWDGKYNGKKVPTGTYLYVIVVNNTEKFCETLTIIY